MESIAGGVAGLHDVGRAGAKGEVGAMVIVASWSLRIVHWVKI